MHHEGDDEDEEKIVSPKRSGRNQFSDCGRDRSTFILTSNTVRTEFDSLLSEPFVSFVIFGAREFR